MLHSEHQGICVSGRMISGDWNVPSVFWLCNFRDAFQHKQTALSSPSLSSLLLRVILNKGHTIVQRKRTRCGIPLPCDLPPNCEFPVTDKDKGERSSFPCL